MQLSYKIYLKIVKKNKTVFFPPQYLKILAA